MMKTTNSRKLRGVQLLAHNKVEMINDSTFRVLSQSGQGSYVVVRKGLNWGCECAQTIIDGFRIYYNFIRPHMALNGKTPAEQAKVRLQLGQNKWQDLIKKKCRKSKRIYF